MGKKIYLFSLWKKALGRKHGNGRNDHAMLPGIMLNRGFRVGIKRIRTSLVCTTINKIVN
jgi:hypothetical protein